MKRVAYVLSAAGQGFWRNPVMSLASTFTVTLMLLLFAFFLTTDRGLQAAVGVLESKVEIALFIDDNAKVSEVLALKARIEADPAVSRVEYVTKEQALKRLQDIADPSGSVTSCARRSAAASSPMSSTTHRSSTSCSRSRACCRSAASRSSR